MQQVNVWWVFEFSVEISKEQSWVEKNRGRKRAFEKSNQKKSGNRHEHLRRYWSSSGNSSTPLSSYFSLQSDKIDIVRKLEEVKEEEIDNFGKEEENSLIEFIDAADKKNKAAKAQNQSTVPFLTKFNEILAVKNLFEREMAAVKTRITRAEEMHQLIKKSDLNSNS